MRTCLPVPVRQARHRFEAPSITFRRVIKGESQGFSLGSAIPHSEGQPHSDQSAMMTGSCGRRQGGSMAKAKYFDAFGELTQFDSLYSFEDLVLQEGSTTTNAVYLDEVTGNRIEIVGKGLSFDDGEP